MKLKMSKEVDLGKEPIGHLLFVLAVPSIISQVVNALYNMVDRMYIGHIPGEGAAALTGLGVCFPIIMIVSAFAALMGMGGAPRASILMGKKDNEGAEKILGNCFSALVITAVVLTALVLVFKRPLLMMFGASENTIGYAESYLNIYAVGTIFVQLTLGLNAFIAAQGFSKISMMTVVIGAVTNIVLDTLLIFGIGPFPQLGMRGAALATGIGQLVTLAFYLVIYRLRPVSVHITRKGLHGTRGITARLYAVGIPAALNLALPSLLISCLNALLAELSQAYVVVLGIYYKLQTFLYLPASGIIQGMRPVIGYNYGAGERERVSRIFQVALALCACIMMIGTVLCLAFASPLMALFTENIRTVVIGAHALRIICVGFLVSAVSVTASGALEGLGKGTASLVISLCRYTVVILPIAVVLCRIMGANGVWHAFWVTEFISAGVAWVAWKRV